MDEVLKEFQNWLLEEGESLQMMESYVYDVKQIQLYVMERVADEGQLLSCFLFVRYKQDLQGRQLAVSTINKAVNILKVYKRLLTDKRYWLKTISFN
ncbi:hypothetical protein CSV63_15415 [Sporosarcina sp. P34]|uniref:hypothetical protein n=1 Tax=Sporosarcina sp. P34 TaxID=2048247 RepID=UPI000C172653|nr:hypothetical protein [Sporosarcina sp. P34]PID13900.1 hypothetical protein CSV63_15415 [Sporosarcina sp. P34]